MLGPIVVGDGLGRSAWGWALAALMGGFIVGGLVSLRWQPRHGLFVGTALLSLTAAFPFAMALSDHLAPLLLGAFVHGFGLEIFSVNWDLSIQQNVAEDKLARVYSFDLVGSFVARPLGLAFTGPVAAAVGFDRWLVVVGLVMGGSALLSLLFPSVQRLERADWTVGPGSPRLGHAPPGWICWSRTGRTASGPGQGDRFLTRPSLDPEVSSPGAHSAPRMTARSGTGPVAGRPGTSPGFGEEFPWLAAASVRRRVVRTADRVAPDPSTTRG